MTSQINPYNINGNYPIAGQDNDSQGFRDNFTNLRNNLVFAKSEIEDLQNKVVLKRPLAGGSINDAAFNEMDGTKLSNVQLRGWSQTAATREMSADNTLTIDPSIANFWQLSVTEADCGLKLDGFPLGTSAGWGQVVVAIAATEAGNSIKFTNNINGVELIAGYDGTDTVVFDEASTPRLFLIGSPNNSDFYIVDLSKNAVDGNLAISPLIAEPTAKTGMIAFANGDATDGWDPLGTDAGVPYPVYYDGSDWVTFAGAGGGATVINGLTDVNITSVANNDILIYNSSSNKWINADLGESLLNIGSDAYPLVEYAVTVADDGSGTQEVFHLNGTALKNSAGEVFTFVLNTNTRYRFDVSDSSNGAFKFSTTPDTEVPASITDYTTGVTVVGTPGTAGAYVEIVITDATPSPLYFWTPDLASPTRDGTLIGAALPIHINGRAKPAQEIDSGDAIDLSLGAAYFNVVGAETATLAAGIEAQTMVLACSSITSDESDPPVAGVMVVTVDNAGWGGDGTITFLEQGQTANLMYINGKWFCIGAGPGVSGTQPRFD